ncbi:MAG: hypothetical protein Q8K74_11885 [Candidatus Nitrotoga sp.]|nr:hypothetical protein [Candidatus Nitrotoga sp.]MDP1856714.1 hypothetical protein [Candidatus Nitrotoga sp.]
MANPNIQGTHFNLSAMVKCALIDEQNAAISVINEMTVLTMMESLGFAHLLAPLEL